MVDLKKIFEESFNLLKKDKKVVIPIFFSIIIPMILILLFLTLSGLFPLLKELEVADKDFSKQKTDYLLDKENIGDKNYTLELLGYLGKDSSGSPYNDQFVGFLNNQGYDFNRFLPLLNAKNIIMGIIFAMFYMASSIYFSIMSYVAITQAIKKRKPYVLTNLTNNFILRFIIMKILLTIIFIVPLIIFVFVAFLSPRSFLIIFFVLIILYFVYLIYMSLKLLFTIPSMFTDGTGATQSIKSSFTSTKGHLKQVFFIGVIIWGIGLFTNSIIGQPLYQIFPNLIYEVNVIKILINFLLLLIFIILQSIVITFQRVFLFYSYVDYKTDIKKQYGGK